MKWAPRSCNADGVLGIFSDNISRTVSQPKGIRGNDGRDLQSLDFLFHVFSSLDPFADLSLILKLGLTGERSVQMSLEVCIP